jgi:hypothetical protein
MDSMFDKTPKEKAEDEDMLLHIFTLWEKNNKVSRDLAVFKYRNLRNHFGNEPSRDELVKEYNEFIK